METERCPFYGIDCEYIPVAQKATTQADEIERLREALQKIVDYDWSWEGGGKLGKIEGFCAKIARSALQQKDSE